VRQLGRERHGPFADEGQSVPIRSEAAFLSLVHESLSRTVTIERALTLAGGFRALRADRVYTAIDDVRIIIPRVGERR